MQDHKSIEQSAERGEQRFENEGLRCFEGTMRGMLWSVPCWLLILLLVFSGCASAPPQKRFYKVARVELEIHVCDEETYRQLPVTQDFIAAEGYCAVGMADKYSPTIWMTGEWSEDGIHLPSIVMGHEVIHQLHNTDQDFTHPHDYAHPRDRRKRR